MCSPFPVQGTGGAQLIRDSRECAHGHIQAVINPSLAICTGNLTQLVGLKHLLDRALLPMLLSPGPEEPRGGQAWLGFCCQPRICSAQEGELKGETGPRTAGPTADICTAL